MSIKISIFFMNFLSLFFLIRFLPFFSFVDICRKVFLTFFACSLDKNIFFCIHVNVIFEEHFYQDLSDFNCEKKDKFYNQTCLFLILIHNIKLYDNKLANWLFCRSSWFSWIFIRCFSILFNNYNISSIITSR